MYRLPLLALLLAQSVTPELRIESVPELAAIRVRLEMTDRQRLAEVTRLVGNREAGPPIRLVLATETSAVARAVPAWIAGFAVGESDLVVIFPARSPSYPDKTIEDVVRHEVAHVLIWRAAGGRAVPRWFDEGLAMAAERERRFNDQTQLLYQLVSGSRISLTELNRLFSGTQADQSRAYALAGAIVQDLLERRGPLAGAAILAAVSGGSSFATAFDAVTGKTPDQMDDDFWRSHRVWTTWVPVITSSGILWSGITLLALLAIQMRRRRNREIEKRWAEEEKELEQADNRHDERDDLAP